tara:strand:- start:624 stop:1814 length:1191 start_codon:yes stop_codon:yes gene_type:complete
MEEKLIFSNNNTSINDVSNIDAEAGIIYGVKEAEGGLNKNGYYFTEELLNGLMSQGNAGEGIKARFGHPTQGLESLGTYIGRKRNFRIENGSLYADLHLDSLTKDTMVNGTSTFNFIIQMAKNNPDMMGCSVVFSASTDTKEINGETFNVPSLVKFTASDLVDEPAATNHLFNSKTNTKTMSEKIQNILEGVKLTFNTALEGLKTTTEEVVVSDVVDTLDTGLQVTIATDETDVPKIGDAVTLTEGGEVALDGVHVTASGLEITVVDGLISEIVEVEAEEEEEETEEELEVVEEESLETQFNSLQKDFIQFQESTKEFMSFSAESYKTALSAVKESSDVQALAFASMKLQAEESEAKYQVLASSIESPAADSVNKEVLPTVKSEGVVADYLAKRVK